MSWITDQITLDDFEGNIRLPSNSSHDNYFRAVISKQVPIYMKKLLGIDLYTAFAASYETGSPVEKWTKLWDGTTYEDITTEVNVEFIGCKQMCLYFLWYELREKMGYSTMESDYSNDLSNSERKSPEVYNRNNFLRYNEGVTEFWNAYIYMKNSIDNDSDDYDGLYITRVTQKEINF